MEHWFSQFRGGSPDDRTFQKRLIDTFVNAVYVYDDKLVLTYNYQHGTQTVTRKEVEDFLGSDLAEMSPPTENLENTAFSGEGFFLPCARMRRFLTASKPIAFSRELLMN